MPLDTQRPQFFYGVQGTPFVSAAEAWFWTMDCLDAREGRVRGCGALKVGRPCEPDDIVNAMRRLDLPALHARTVVAWGKRREVPRGTEARRLWDEVMTRLGRVLRAKGIVGTVVHQPAPEGSGPLDVALGRLGAAIAERTECSV